MSKIHCCAMCFGLKMAKLIMSDLLVSGNSNTTNTHIVSITIENFMKNFS